MVSQRVHVGIWYILGAKRGSYIPTLRPKYIPYDYMDPLGSGASLFFEKLAHHKSFGLLTWNHDPKPEGTNRGYIGIMEEKTETTTAYWGIGLYWDNGT